MQNRKRDTGVQNRLLDSVGEGRAGCSERIALKQVCCQGWNRSPAQVGCMRQVLRAGALGRPRGMGWGGRREGGLRWGTQVNPWLIHVNIMQKPLQYCKVISLQLIKINGKKKEEEERKLLWDSRHIHLMYSQALYSSVPSLWIQPTVVGKYWKKIPESRIWICPMLATDYIVFALYLWDFAGYPVVKTHISGTVPFLVGELRSHMSTVLPKIVKKTLYLWLYTYHLHCTRSNLEII